MRFFHLLNRGVDKRDVFLDKQDYARFVHLLYILNDAEPLDRNHTRVQKKSKDRDPLLHIHAFCLMPNHYHILISPIKDGAIPIFMKRLNKAYAQYFNAKYHRVGSLWQGKYKSVPILKDSHFMYIPHYIHANPLDLYMPEWRRAGIKDIKKALNYLKEYRWSSLPSYLGENNFNSVTNRKAMEDIFDSKKYSIEFLDAIKNLDTLLEDAHILETGKMKPIG